jgi:hypothetical protein
VREPSVSAIGTEVPLSHSHLPRHEWPHNCRTVTVTVPSADHSSANRIAQCWMHFGIAFCRVSNKSGITVTEEEAYSVYIWVPFACMTCEDWFFAVDWMDQKCDWRLRWRERYGGSLTCNNARSFWIRNCYASRLVLGVRRWEWVLMGCGEDNFSARNCPIRMKIWFIDVLQ